MKRHVAETDLALYAAGDLPFGRRVLTRLHVRQCEECRGLVGALRADREELLRSADEMPANLSKNFDWDQLAAEMTANIRVGLAAGECVTPRERKVATIAWRPAAIAAAGLVVLMAGAWWLNIPRTDTEAIGRALHNMATGGRATSPEERGPVVAASSLGVELVDNGGRLGIEQSGLQPVMFSVSAQGSASARYIDQDTGQVTITAVYVQ